jgi:hypothetical protein
MSTLWLRPNKNINGYLIKLSSVNVHNKYSLRTNTVDWKPNNPRLSVPGLPNIGTMFSPLKSSAALLQIF